MVYNNHYRYQFLALDYSHIWMIPIHNVMICPMLELLIHICQEVSPNSNYPQSLLPTCALHFLTIFLPVKFPPNLQDLSHKEIVLWNLPNLTSVLPCFYCVLCFHFLHLPCFYFFNWVLSVQSPITEYYRQGGLITEICFLRVLEVVSPRPRCQQG